MRNNVSPQLLALWQQWSQSLHWGKLKTVLPVVYQQIEVDGVPHRFCVWLPGPHPRDATWCEELSAWIRVSRLYR